MGDNGAQKYVDQFKSVAVKLGWNLQEEAVIYQFKTGLLQWILTQLPTTELNFILTMETNPVIEIKHIDILMKLVMRLLCKKENNELMEGMITRGTQKN